MLDRIIKKVPIVSDYYSYYWIFPKKITACRGIYSSFNETLKAVSNEKLAVYNQPIISQHRSVAQLTACAEKGIPAWHVPDLDRPSKYLQVGVTI